MVKRIRSAPIAYITLFVTGAFCAKLLDLALQGNLRSGDWLLLAPFSLAVSVFAVLAAVFVLQARRDLKGEAEGAHTTFKRAVEQANRDFDRRLERAERAFDEKTSDTFAALRAGIDGITKESTIVFEPDFDDASQQSRCYERLIELVNGAEKSIFSIPNPYRRSAQDHLELNWRAGYLRTIERKIADMHQAGAPFEYIRIQQVPPGATDLRANMGNIEWQHVQRLRDLRYGNTTLMVIDKDQITGQLIIDEKIFVNLITAVDTQGRKRMVAIGIMKDPLDSSIEEYYAKLKSVLVAKARLVVDIQDLDPEGRTGETA